MKQMIFLIVLFIFTLNLNAQTHSEYNHHNLFVQINIPESSIDVIDSISLSNNEMKVFYLNSNLIIYESNCNVKEIGYKNNYKKYQVNTPYNNNITIKYKGVLDHNKEELLHITKENMFQSTEGIIFENGIYLSGSTYWIPDFEKSELKTFIINATIDKDWKLVSQGNLISEEIKDSTKHLVFKMDFPTNQICLIGNKWFKYSDIINNIDMNVYLINNDEGLAQKYNGVTSQYLDLYEKIIAPFPYSKFDVIENFWESGYGMPSFTLLGQKIIRFPWILNTSYPHELLHNYWGNSVYVDYENGNWCEGITTYMADYLLKEKDGEGNIFRQSQLIKYTDYVNIDNDFPVNRFKSKYDEASEAIGYSKVLMINHMLRIKYGTEVFLKSYADFYQSHKFKTASFEDIQKSFEKISGSNLENFFNQWLKTKGAPEIILKNVYVKNKNGAYILNFEIEQTNIENTFNLDIPVFIYLNKSNKVERKLLSLNKKSESYSFIFSENPVRIDIDPQYDVMRILNKSEVSPSLSQILGSDKWTIILPSESTNYNYYKDLADTWSKMYIKQGKQIEVINDNNIIEFPNDHSVWILGIDNKFAKNINIYSTYNSIVAKDVLDKIDSLNQNDLVVYTLKNPNNKNETVGYINSKFPEVLVQLPMKFVHYGNYSYLGFEGKKLQNVLKGYFPVIDSPLSYIIEKNTTIDWNIFQLPQRDFMYK